MTTAAPAAPTGPADADRAHRLDAAGPMAPAPRVLFAGFTLKELLAILAFAAVALWAAWATRELLALKERRTVSVSLTTMVQSFVAAEARRGADQGKAAARTKAYLGAIDAAMRAISSDGTTILVSEAVLGNSVPDVTATVMKAVNARVGLSTAHGSEPTTPQQPLPTASAFAPGLPDEQLPGAATQRPWATREQRADDGLGVVASPGLPQ